MSDSPVNKQTVNNWDPYKAKLSTENTFQPLAKVVLCSSFLTLETQGNTCQERIRKQIKEFFCKKAEYILLSCIGEFVWNRLVL